MNYKILATVEKISEGDRSIRGRQLKKYQMATEVSEGDRSIRGREVEGEKISEVTRGGGGGFVSLKGGLGS